MLQTMRPSIDNYKWCEDKEVRHSQSPLGQWYICRHTRGLTRKEGDSPVGRRSTPTSNKGLGYKTYTKLFHIGVTPILEYCSGIWGVCKARKNNTVQNRAIRYFIVTPRFSPNLAINGDMGLSLRQTRQGVEMARLWNRLVNMENDHLT